MKKRVHFTPSANRCRRHKIGVRLRFLQELSRYFPLTETAVNYSGDYIRRALWNISATDG